MYQASFVTVAFLAYGISQFQILLWESDDYSILCPQLDAYSNSILNKEYD